MKQTGVSVDAVEVSDMAQRGKVMHRYSIKKGNQLFYQDLLILVNVLLSFLYIIRVRNSFLPFMSLVVM